MSDDGKRTDLGHGITASCDGYAVYLERDRYEHIKLTAPSLHALIAFARERGLLEG